VSRLVLLGASGFIGAHVLAALRGLQGSDVTCIGRSPPADEGTRWIPFDVAPAAVEGLASILDELRPTAIVNCIGRTTGTPGELVAANAAVVAVLLEAVGRSSRPVRIVHVASAAEYGATPHGVRVSESAPSRPSTAYAITKLAGTQLLCEAHTSGRADAVSLRVFNPIGSRLSPTTVLGRAAAQIEAAAATGSDRIEMGDLTAYRDFVDVRDVAEAVVAAIRAPRLGVPVLNVGSGRATLVRDAVHGLAAIAGFTGEVAEDRRGSPRSATVSWNQADISATVAALGWAPVIDLASSLRSLWQSAHTALAEPGTLVT
jgi:NDP-hexose 4-ketoreductase